MGRRGLQEGVGGARQVSFSQPHLRREKLAAQSAPHNASLALLPSRCCSASCSPHSHAQACARRRQRVLSFDIHHDTCTILKKGKVERTEAISSLVAFTEDDTHATVLSLQFAPPDDPKTAKKFEEVVRLEVLNPFDRQII